MRFTLTKPCLHCPFRNDIQTFLRPERAEDIARGLYRGTFSCHETSEYDDEEEVIEGDSIQHCAGALIMLEKASRPSQAMRIAERLGIYDCRGLDMGAPVYESPEEFVAAHKRRKDGEGEHRTT